MTTPQPVFNKDLDKEIANLQAAFKEAVEEYKRAPDESSHERRTAAEQKLAETVRAARLAYQATRPGIVTNQDDEEK